MDEFRDLNMKISGKGIQDRRNTKCTAEMAVVARGVTEAWGPECRQPGRVLDHSLSLLLFTTCDRATGVLRAGA